MNTTYFDKILSSYADKSLAQATRWVVEKGEVNPNRMRRPSSAGTGQGSDAASVRMLSKYVL